MDIALHSWTRRHLRDQPTRHVRVESQLLWTWYWWRWGYCCWKNRRWLLIKKEGKGSFKTGKADLSLEDVRRVIEPRRVGAVVRDHWLRPYSQSWNILIHWWWGMIGTLGGVSCSVYDDWRASWGLWWCPTTFRGVGKGLERSRRFFLMFFFRVVDDRLVVDLYRFAYVRDKVTVWLHLMVFVLRFVKQSVVVLARV